MTKRWIECAVLCVVFMQLHLPKSLWCIQLTEEPCTSHFTFYFVPGWNLHVGIKVTSLCCRVMVEVLMNPITTLVWWVEVPAQSPKHIKRQYQVVRLLNSSSSLKYKKMLYFYEVIDYIPFIQRCGFCSGMKWLKTFCWTTFHCGLRINESCILETKLQTPRHTFKGLRLKICKCQNIWVYKEE